MGRKAHRSIIMNEQIARQIQANPRAMQALSAAVQKLVQNPKINPDVLSKLVNMLEFVLERPDSYAEFRQTLISSGAVDPEDLPAEFEEFQLTVVLMALKLALRQVSEGGPGFSAGGLNRLARAGRRGDDRLAHINGFEEKLLKAYGGSGTINPKTGLPEYGILDDLGDAIGDVFKAVAPVLPIVLSVVAPGIGTALGTALGASGVGATMLGSALIGGAGAALSGGDPLKGAVLGGLSGGLGGTVGGAANSAFGLGLGEAGQSILGSGLVGGLTGAASGQGFVKGALQGAGGAYLGGQLGELGSSLGGATGAGLNTAGGALGNMLAAGYKPKEALTGSVLAGLAGGMMGRGTAGSDLGTGLKSPSELAVGELKAPSSVFSGVPEAGYGTTDYLTGQSGYTGPESLAVDYSLQNPGAPVATAGYGAQDVGSGLTAPRGALPGPSGAAGSSSGGFSLGNAGKALMLASMLKGAPQPVQQAVSSLSPQQQEYFNRPSVTWDWARMQNDAAARGMSLAEYMAGNWNAVASGAYNQPSARFARGGLSQMAYLASGGGTGRSDSIPARLSDGEYVLDAETVSLLGDGSTTAGARRLDEMRAKIREHKGRSMARGKFSANAKSPLSYLKEAR